MRYAYQEILAPGGSPEGIRRAIAAGADAVYTGGPRFGARSYADNPDEKGLMEAIDFCHLHGRRLYLTVNTLLKEDELEGELYEYLEPLCRQGVDAVLVQDMGVLRFLRRELPQLPVHASTQMSVQSPQGARMLGELGVSRIVPARELSLEEIARICDETGLEVECFVHGALCLCYSGQCLLSSLIGGRSGNRGRCAQPCRRAYTLTEEARAEQGYLMSMKDLCALDVLPQLIESGVCSYKIEGRMKRPEYAAGVTAIYRRYLDLYLEKGQGGYHVREEDRRALLDLYNRGGFTDGYYRRHNGPEMMASDRPNHAGTPAARVQSLTGPQVQLKALEPLYPGDVLDWDGGGRSREEMQSRIGSGVKQGAPFEMKLPGALRGRLRAGAVVPRVHAEHLLGEIRLMSDPENIKEKITGIFRLQAGCPAILTVTATLFGDEITAEVTGEIPSAARSRAVTEDDLRSRLQKLGATPFEWADLMIRTDPDLFLPMGEVGRMRREALELLQQRCAGHFRRPAGAVQNPPEGTEAVSEHETEPASPAGAGLSPQKAKPSVPAAAANERNGVSDSAKITCLVSTRPQLQAALEQEGIARIYLDALMYLAPVPGGSIRPGPGRSRKKPQDGACTDGQSCAKNEKNEKSAKNPGNADSSGEQRQLQLDAERIHGRGWEVYLALPPVWREPVQEHFYRTFPEPEQLPVDGFLLRCLDETEVIPRLGHPAIVDAGLYTWNRESRQMFRELGAAGDCAPLELNRRELAGRTLDGSELVVYGYLPLMITAQCFRRNAFGCSGARTQGWLRDPARSRFPVRCECGICTNIVYNREPLDLTDLASERPAADAASWRICLTIEDYEESAAVLRRSIARMSGIKSEPDGPDGPRTRGHYQRGVL